MNKDKVRLYKNPNRGDVEKNKNYIPQYQLKGLTPEFFETSNHNNVAGAVVEKPALSSNAVREEPSDNFTEVNRRIGIGRNAGPLINVGNNMEHTWSSLDGELIDDLSDELAKPDVPMIDNNDYVADSAFQLKGTKTFLTEQDLTRLNNMISVEESVEEADAEESDDLVSVVTNLESGTHLLLVDGVPFVTGDVAFIEEQAASLLLGNHEACGGEPVDIDSIIVLKKLTLKFGLSAE